MQDVEQAFTETTTAVARGVPCQADLVRDYCDMGLIRYVRLPNGMRLLQKRAIDDVRAIKARRMAARGHTRAA